MSASMKGKVVVVLGGTGTVGGGVVYMFLKSGATVVVPARNENSRLALEKDLEGLTHNGTLDVFMCSISDEASCDSLRDYIKQKYNGTDHVVSSIGGGCKMAPLSTFSLADTRQIFQDRVEGHILAYGRMFPLLREHGSYTFITGGLATVCPAPQFSLMTITSAAVVGIFKAACAEAKGSDKNVNELRISLYIRRVSAEKTADTVSAIEIGRVCVMIAEQGHHEMELRINSAADLEHLLE